MANEQDMPQPAARNEALNVNISVITFVSSGLISNEATEIFSWINYLLCEIIAMLGSGANTLNIVCFVKLDLKDPINVSFLGLAISDLGSLVMMLWTALCMTPLFDSIDVPFDPVDMQALVTGWPHIAFTRVTSWITALITLERCLCITMPLKVKSIFTTKGVATIIASIFAIIIAGVSPLYFCSSYAWVFSPERNRTILMIVYRDSRIVSEKIAHGLANAFMPLSAYAVVIVCTVVLVVKLRAKSKWRLKCTAKQDGNIMSSRDQRIAKMVVMVSTLFIVSFIPMCFIFISMIVEPRISADGQFKNLLFVMGGFSILLECTNSSLNIFIYYHMSSRYKETLRQLFGKKQKFLQI